MPNTLTPREHEAVATFAGGCFRCLQPGFDSLSGVISTLVGYAGGSEVNPTYEQVAYGQTSHREAIQMIYDPSLVTYQELLDEYFLHIDPTDPDGQFVDKGMHYTTAVFYHDDQQKQITEDYFQALTDAKKYDKPIVTKIIPYTTFYPAEDYHQKYYLKAKDRYNRYKDNSGREEYFEQFDGLEEESQVQ